MFDGLLKSKFYKKSKMALKVTKMRLETIKKKRAAVDRYLQKDIADLLRNDLDINAYGRAEGLPVKRDRTSCYDLVDHFCECISSSHVVAMQKQSECPEECKEAVASLMYAAARFADLPELRELRTLLRGKYGDSLESFVNEEFVGKLGAKPSSEDSKLQLMRDIAAEFSVKWNSKVLEQKLFDANPPKQGSDNGDERKSHAYDETKESIVQLEKSTSSSSEDDDLTQSYGKVGKAVKQSSSSSSSLLDDGVIQKRPTSFRDITPPYVKSKSDTREGDGVDSIQDKPKPRSVRQRRLKPPPRNEDKVVDKHPPTSASSLPLEEATETGKGHCRSASMHPEVLVGHVHPSQPAYHNLAARLAAFRGR